MGYADVFGGALIFPSQTSYIAITTAVDVTLSWPTEQQVGGTNVVADFMDINATVGSLNIDMPSASATSTGNKATFNNVGANTFSVRDSTGGAIISVAAGEQWVVVLTDNSTAAGTWITFQLGATVSVANASALAGAGIKAIATTLNQRIDSDVEAATPITVVDGDRAKCLIYTAGAGTANLPGAGGVGNDWFFMLRNAGSGTLNVLPPSGQIDSQASIDMEPGDSAFIFTDGTDYFTVGFGQGSTFAFDFISLAVPGSGDFTLSGPNLDRISYRFTGALTGNRNIIVPNTTQQYWCDNQTTGAFNLVIKTAAGASVNIPQGSSLITYCDATDVINATSSTSIAFPLTIAQGGTGAVTAGAALTNLGAAASVRILTAGSGMTGGGDLTADRTFNVIGGSGIIANANDVELDITGLINAAPAFDDELAFENVSGSNKRKNTIGVVVGTIIPAAIKPADTPRNNTIVQTADPDLAGFGLEPSSQYIVECVLQFEGNGATANGFRWSFDFNGQVANVTNFTGLSFSFQASGGVESIIGNVSGSLQTKATFDGAGVREKVYIRLGIQTNGSYVSGTAIDLQWAQGTSDATNTSLEIGSTMQVTKIG